MAAPKHTFTHGVFDERALDELLAEEGFTEAFAGSFSLLGTCLVESPKTQGWQRAFEALSSAVRSAAWPFGDREELARAIEALDLAQVEGIDSRVATYARLFRGPGRLQAPPWGSVYMDRDGVTYGWTWVELRSWMRAHGFSGTYEENDPEDHFGRLLVLAAAVAQKRPELLGEFLADHLLCFSGRFLDVLEGAALARAGEPAGASYAALALVARMTLADVAALLGIVPARRRLYR